MSRMHDKKERTVMRRALSLESLVNFLFAPVCLQQLQHCFNLLSGMSTMILIDIPFPP